LDFCQNLKTDENYFFEDISIKYLLRISPRRGKKRNKSSSKVTGGLVVVLEDIVVGASAE
jgi:hypothetical protein